MAREFVRFDEEVILAEIAALRKADKKTWQSSTASSDTRT